MRSVEELAAKFNGKKPVGPKLRRQELPTDEEQAAWRPDHSGGCTDACLPEGRTDAANASRFHNAYGTSALHVWPWGKWLYFDGRRWKVDDEGVIEAWAKQIAAGLWDDIKESIGQGDEGTIRTMMTFAKMTNGANGIKNMLTLARSEEGVPVLPDQLDADPWVLNVANGTLDLRSGALRDHRREDRLTKLCPTAYNPNAACPTWKRVLAEILPGAGMVGYLQRLYGYSLTGLTQEHILPFFYGTGANGKSLVLNTIQEVLGIDYAMKAPPDLLMSKGGQSHPTVRKAKTTLPAVRSFV